jgi:tetratricopeptide (TPR) repeat protein
VRTQAWPWLALAEAQGGDLKSAHAVIARTPLDCYLCLRIRGSIDAVEGDQAGASYWYARAVSAAPSVPFAYADWGEMLLHEGDYDAAIAEFREANLKGPHFADPLEKWGEALVQEKRSDLALAKFEEAAKFAPNWGRLHLKWGEALVYAAKKDQAGKQFALASALDLSAAEKSELARMNGTHG